MKKILMLMIMVLTCLFAFTANAENQPAQQKGMDWEISMMPKPSEEEQEAARWSVVVENNVGIYAYDMDSLAYSQVINGIADKNIVSVLTKTVFTDKEILKKLNAKYKEALPKKEKVQYCEIYMTFNLTEKTYAVQGMDVFSNKKTVLEHQAKPLKFVPIPQGSFAEAMLEICQQAVNNDATAQK